MAHYLRHISLILGATFLLGAAQSSIRFNRDVEGWNVYGDYADDGVGVCVMEGRYAGGTTIYVHTFGNEADRFWFNLHNPSWRSLDPENEIRLIVRFNDKPEWTINGRTVASERDGPGIKFSVPLRSANGTSFVVDFMGARSMRVLHDGRFIDSFNLRGTRAGVRVLAECRDRIGNSPSFDPFSR